MGTKRRYVNVAETAEDLVADLEQPGAFNSVDIEYITKTGLWHNEYAYFEISFDSSDHGYFDWYTFIDDFIRHLQSWFFSCKVLYEEMGNGQLSIEIQGQKYLEYEERHHDLIENLWKEYEDKNLIVLTINQPGNPVVRAY